MIRIKTTCIGNFFVAAATKTAHPQSASETFVRLFELAILPQYESLILSEYPCFPYNATAHPFHTFSCSYSSAEKYRVLILQHEWLNLLCCWILRCKRQFNPCSADANGGCNGRASSTTNARIDTQRDTANRFLHEQFELTRRHTLEPQPKKEYDTNCCHDLQ